MYSRVKAGEKDVGDNKQRVTGAGRNDRAAAPIRGIAIIAVQ